MNATRKAWPDPVRRCVYAATARLRRQGSLAASALLTAWIAIASRAAEVDASSLPPPAPGQIDFAREIKPILTNNCYKCHSGDRPKSHFLLTSRESALKGGNEGVDIIAGQSAKSPLIHYVSGLVPDMEMPPEGKGTPLTKEQVGLLRAWIDQGVAWEQTMPESSTEASASPTVGWTTVSGDREKFRELYWQREGWNGGVEDFELTERLGPDSRITAAGHVLLYDYLLTLTAEKNDLGFTQFGWSQYRKYFDDSGGYYPAFSPPIFDLNQDLHLDIGRAWANFGLALPQWPRMVLGYEYQYEQGTKSTTQWGLVGPGTDPTQARNIYPAFEDISEHTHILKFDLDYEVNDARITDSFRGEWYNLATSQVNDSFYNLDTAEKAVTTANERQTHFQGANTVHLEKQFTDWLFASGGYLYSQFNGDAAVDVSTMNPSPLAPAIGWNALSVVLERDSHVFSVGAMLGQWEGLTLSLGSQNEWTRQHGSGSANVDLAQPFPPGSPPFPLGQDVYFSDFDRSTFSQDVGVRFTKIPFTTLFVDGRLQQESVGQTADATGDLLTPPYLLETDVTSKLKDLRAGFNTSPWRRVSLSGQYRYYDHRTDYNNSFKESLGQPYEGYPGFILWRDLLTQEAEIKLNLQLTPRLKTTFSYQYLDSDYHTATEPVAGPGPGGIAPGGSLLAGTYTAHTAAFNATLTPWRRLFLSTTFSYQNARTVTAANGSPAVAPYEGDIYSVMASGSYTLNQMTDLTAAYSLSMADFAQDNFAGGLPLGIKYQQQGVQLGIKRHIGKGKTFSLQYSFYHYDEPSSGRFNNFNAQAIFATLAFPLR